MEKTEGRAIIESVESWINVNKEDKIRNYVERWVKKQSLEVKSSRA